MPGFLDGIINAGPSGGGINSPGAAPNPFPGQGGDGAPAPNVFQTKYPYGLKMKEGAPGDVKGYWVMGPNGARGRLIRSDQLDAEIKGYLDSGQMTAEEAGATLGQYGIAVGPNGSISHGNEPSQPGQPATPAARPGGGGSPAAPGGGGSPAVTPGGSPSVPGLVNPDPNSSQNQGGTTPPIGGAGPTGIDPNRDLGVNDPGAAPQSLGDFFSGSRGGLGGGTSIFDQLGPNPTMKDVLGAVQRAQEGTRDAQLDIQAGLFGESLNSAQSQGQRANLDHVLANPESMSPEVLSKVKGQMNQAIGQRASRGAQLAKDQAASLGVGRDIGQRESNRMLREGAAQQTEAERALTIDAAKTNFADRLNSLGAAGGEIARDQGARRDIGNVATQVHGASQDRGDTFLTNALLTAPETPKLASANQVRFSGQPQANYRV